MLTITELEAEISRRAAQIGAQGDQLPTYEYVEQTARPGVLVNERGYHLIVAERGSELSRLTTTELDVLLYEVFEIATWEMASDHEAKHRVAGQDVRRLLFQQQLDLLAALSPEWATRRSAYYARVLSRHPFDDDGGRRRELARDLLRDGQTSEEAYRIAEQTYPRPVPPPQK